MVIDAHCHVAEQGAKTQTAEELLRRMDAMKVDCAVVCPSDGETALRNREGNRRLASLVRAHRDRLVGMAVANAWYGDEALLILREAQDMGLFGLKIHPPLQGMQLSDELLDPVLEFAAGLGWPVYCHTGTPICSEPLQLAELARRHPTARLIMGHMGWSDFVADAVPAAMLSENIYLETSHVIGGLVYAAVAQLGSNRILMGSDAPASTLDAELFKFSTVPLTSRDRASILGETAARLFSIPNGKGS